MVEGFWIVLGGFVVVVSGADSNGGICICIVSLLSLSFSLLFMDP